MRDIAVGFSLTAMLFAATLSDVARADPAPDPAPERRYGIGMTVGGGYGVGMPTGFLAAGFRTVEQGVRAPEVVLPILEFAAFNRTGSAFEVLVPVTDFSTSLPLNFRTLFYVDTFYAFNFGKGPARFIVGPGSGFAVGISGLALRFPAETGIELLTKSQAFGFKLLARPYVELLPTENEVGAGGGATFVIGLFGYPQRKKPKCL